VHSLNERPGSFWPVTGLDETIHPRQATRKSQNVAQHTIGDWHAKGIWVFENPIPKPSAAVRSIESIPVPIFGDHFQTGQAAFQNRFRI